MEKFVPKATLCALLLLPGPKVAREEQVVRFGVPAVAASQPIPDPDGATTPESGSLVSVGLGLGLLIVGTLRRRHQH